MTQIASEPNSTSGPSMARPARAEELLALSDDRERLLRILTAGPDSLYAVLDAARDLRALDWLKESREEYQCLYDGKSAVDLEMFAPYLVRFSAESPLLRRLVAQAWGLSWGIYLKCAQNLPDLRKHLRHFLKVEVEGEAGKSFYFRFYDPRVLRVYLPTCTPGEARDFFGPIWSVLVEGQDPSLILQFRPGSRGSQFQITHLEGDDVQNP